MKKKTKGWRDTLISIIAPPTKVYYEAGPEPYKRKKKKPRPGNYKIPATPKESGIGWGP
jgi:hypothetical protein